MSSYGAETFLYALSHAYNPIPQSVSPHSQPFPSTGCLSTYPPPSRPEPPDTHLAKLIRRFSMKHARLPKRSRECARGVLPPLRSGLGAHRASFGSTHRQRSAGVTRSARFPSGCGATSSPRLITDTGSWSTCWPSKTSGISSAATSSESTFAPKHMEIIGMHVGRHIPHLRCRPLLLVHRGLLR